MIGCCLPCCDRSGILYLIMVRETLIYDKGFRQLLCEIPLYAMRGCH